MELTEEELKEFKAIPGYRHFLVSRDGRVYRQPHKAGYRAWEGALRPVKNGKINLSQDGQARLWRIEALIEQAFGVSHKQVPVQFIVLAQKIVQAHSADDPGLDELVDQLSQLLHKEKLWVK